MGKAILAIVVSYIAMLVLLMAIFTGLFFALRVERVLQPDSYEVSTLWLVVTIVVSFLGAILAGYLCAAIGKSWRTCQVFALIVFLLTLLSCISALKRNPDAPNVRAGEVGYRDAIQLAVTPLWLHLLNPVISGAAVLIGARMKQRGNT
jgi:hypothetical protein